jgi:death-on-curing protein
VEIAFLTPDEMAAIHRDQIERYGGSLGVRECGLLQSANAMPAAAFGGQYLHTDVCEMAAAYLFHIVQNHPFIDGNKRVGFMAAYVFLDRNGLQLAASEAEATAVIRAVAAGEINEVDLAAWLRANTRKSPNA